MYSKLVSYVRLSPHFNKRSHPIDRITIHHAAGNASVEALGALFCQKEASANYGIGSDGRIACFVEEENRSWASGSPENDHRAITIEVANTVAEHPWPVSEAAYASLIDLCTDICKRNGIKKLLWQGDKSLIGQVDKQNMTVHRWFANKACPGEWLYERHGEIAAEVNRRLLEQEDDDMDKARFTELFNEMRRDLQDNDCGQYSEEARNWATETGLILGGGDLNGEPNYMWQDMMTREQFVTVLYRFAQMMGAV